MRRRHHAGRAAGALAGGQGRLPHGVRLLLHGLRGRRRHGNRARRSVEGGDLLRRRRLLHDGELRTRHRGDAARPLHHRADRQPRLRLHQPPAAGVRRRRVQQHVQGLERRGAAGDRLRRARRLDGRPCREGGRHRRPRGADRRRPRPRHPHGDRHRHRGGLRHRRRRPLVGRRGARRSAAPSASRRPASATTPTPASSASSTEVLAHDPLRNQPHRLVERRRLVPRRSPFARGLPRRLPPDRLRRHREGAQDARRRDRAAGASSASTACASPRAGTRPTSSSTTSRPRSGRSRPGSTSPGRPAAITSTPANARTPCTATTRCR